MRGQRNMDTGPEPIPTEDLSAVRTQAWRVVAKASAVALLLTALSVLLP